ncbi:LysR family transcriptional regulator [Paradevosia shaoguanensis]|uniref:LysR family transcriptional regulator n=1 Tax=Paradevosia shaoguanensis TaxID=1335043 RepID=A0AA41U9S8_9HYPH|nr:LysR family transcriptional regulator [Paradevosia shaoguanensis]MCF1741125.1 LysR family transcriptional regulator [Paradevosia shaoguanensis]MCI0125608.1 LysR family transcriptional regulator [Paradevosia shaoguanensis]
MRGSLDLRRLRYFQVIADCGSMSAAARLLNLAQPALSYHVAELERLTGHVLFERSRDGVRLTEAGRLLRQHASAIVSQVDEAEQALERLGRQHSLPAQRVRIAVISSLAAGLTPLLLERVSSELPGITLHIQEAGTRDIAQKLERGEADIALYLTGNTGRTDEPIAREKLFHVSAGDGTIEDTIALAMLVRQPLVLPAPGNPLRNFVDTIARQHGLNLDVALEVDGSRSRLTAVRNGMGATIVGAHAIGEVGVKNGLVVREITAPTLFRPIYLGIRRELDPHLANSMRGLLAGCLVTLGLEATSP